MYFSNTTVECHYHHAPTSRSNTWPRAPPRLTGDSGYWIQPFSFQLLEGNSSSNLLRCKREAVRHTWTQLITAYKQV
uniref:Uncharacterized protein n=1 Tax=Anguilla anguilla TaxID=7936 RepID=A0A0E9WSS7_ANGAN